MASYAVLGLEGDLPPALKLQEMICGKWVSQTIYVAAELGIADQLRDETQSADEIAEAVGSQKHTTYRLMRALSSLGILEEHDDKQFSLTVLGQALRSDHEESMKAYARLLGSESNWRAWEVMTEAVRTGNSSYEIVYGMKLFDYLAKHPDAAKIFDDAMVATNHITALQLAKAYDFSGINTLVDVGGGKGALLATIAEANLDMRGIVYDTEYVAEGARQLLDERGLVGRCQFVTGNFFEVVPSADCCILKCIIHDWGDEEAIRILRNCVAAIPANGKVLVAERVVPPPGISHISKLIDLEMLALTGGVERTTDEYRELFEQAGLQVTQLVPTKGLYTVIEGVPDAV